MSGNNEDNESSQSESGAQTSPQRPTVLGPPPDMSSLRPRTLHPSLSTSEEVVGSGGGNMSAFNSIPSVGTQRSKFVLEHDVPDEEISNSDVVILKDKRGDEGSKHWNSIMETATRALTKQFGVSKHKIVTPEGAEASSENHTKSLRIQNTIMDLLLRVDEGLHRCKRVDFMDILLIPNFNKTPSNDPAPSSSANKATNPSAKYVSADLNLVSDQNYAAMFHLERVPSYRHGKLDVALTLTLISRNQHDLVLCSTGEGDVVFVTRDRLDTKDVSTGEYTYNISWEATPDSDATLMCEQSGEQGEGGEGGEGGVPLEKYMEDFSYRMLSSK